MPTILGARTLMAANGADNLHSIRAEVRFTRDVDLAVIATDDADAENLIFELKRVGYVPIVTVEYELRARLSTVRLLTKGRSSLRKLRHRIRNRPPSHNRLSNSGNEP